LRKKGHCAVRKEKGTALGYNDSIEGEDAGEKRGESMHGSSFYAIQQGGKGLLITEKVGEQEFRPEERSSREKKGHFGLAVLFGGR